MENGRRGKSDFQKRGAVKYIATGNGPSYVSNVNVTDLLVYNGRLR